MDINEYFKYKETPFEKLKDELFTTTSEYKYFNFGVASTMAKLYKIIKDIGDNKLTGNELAEIIKISVDDREDLHDYFYQLLQ